MKNGQTQICLKPSDQQIDDYLATYNTYNNEADALADLDRFIIEQTPIMFEVFYNCDSIPQEIRNNFEL